MFFGDSSAQNSIYLNDSIKHKVDGLPINDSSIKQAFRRYETFDVIFFHCTYPLAGCKEIEFIKNLQRKDIDLRTTSYRHKPDSKGFYNDEWWKNLSVSDIDFLFENWMQMIDYYYQQNPKIVLLPVRAHYYDKQLNLPNKAIQMLTEFDRIVDLSPLNNYNKRNYIDKFGNLSKQGFNLIKDNILKWLEN
ncbi:hypothetical protein [Okeania sp. KiyG1]|uniref:hypothetical protein n=1 Tax=Okeania sp. KiyG1 TaxID=2720165 RepID=UPI001F16060E|nr:hypothetical protein [Okeania sp. KiyG1]